VSETNIHENGKIPEGGKKVSRWSSLAGGVQGSSPTPTVKKKVHGQTAAPGRNALGRLGIRGKHAFFGRDRFLC